MGGPELIRVEGTPRGVHAVFTTRLGGMSTGEYAALNLGIGSGDDLEAVRMNRRALAATCGFDPGRATTVIQVHGSDVVEVGAGGGAGRFTGELVGVAEADASTTAARDVALLTQGADCVPVLLWRTDSSRVAAAHAGWRGLVAGVLGNAVRSLGQGPVGAAIGPCVAPCCYPVDQSLREGLGAAFGHDVAVGDAVDLRLAARRALAAAGVEGERIVDVDACTSCDAARFFSYRRDGERTGRQAGVIWLAGR